MTAAYDRRARSERKSTRRSQTVIDVKRAIELRNLGLTMEVISQRLGHSTGAISNAIKRAQGRKR